VASPRNKPKPLVDRPWVHHPSLAANNHARFMLRMRLSLDRGYAAVVPQGMSDNLFAVESLAALTPEQAEAEACYRGTAALADPTLPVRASEHGPEALYVFLPANVTGE
jgi:hypothetical protein